jgi:putative DNA primase/helicase
MFKSLALMLSAALSKTADLACPVMGRTEAVGDADLYGDVRSLCSRLADKGLRIHRTGGKDLADYLIKVNVERRVTLVNRTGWAEIDGVQVFVLPEEGIGARKEHVILAAAGASPYEQKGSLDDWKAGIGELVAGHARPALAVSMAFAGPLLLVAGMDGGGVNLFGQSSRGKSTCAEAAASVRGKGNSSGFLRSWRSTANALEGVAAVSNDTLLALDELGVIEPKEAATAVYQLATGIGKGRLARDASLRVPKT